MKLKIKGMLLFRLLAGFVLLAPGTGFSQPEYTIPGVLYTRLDKALQHPDSVFRLRLRGKRLDKFPEEIARFKHLRELDLSNNRITQLPPWIGQLEQLEILRLGRNRLSGIGKEVTRLKQLKYLDLGMNQIEALPFEIGELSALEFLQVWGNELTALPESITRLEHLRWLDMRNIILTDSERESILELLPHTEVLLSAGCNCGK